MREYATDGEGIGDASEQGAVAVAVWAAQDVLVKYARDQCRPAICGGAGVVFGGKLGWFRGSPDSSPTHLWNWTLREASSQKSKLS